MAQATAPGITKALFGGVLDIDGAGHYPGLELINFIVCCPDGILPSGGRIRLQRVAHDFARRLVRDDQLAEQDKARVLIDEHSAQAVARLLKCLELDIANVAKAKGWERTHFFPYTRSLVHWDARPRRGAISIERRYLRGGGAHAFAVLRSDPDPRRLQAIREGFAALYPEDSASPLETLAATLRAKGKIDVEPVADQLESESNIFNDKWENLFRDGVANILGHASIPAVQRVRAIVNWTGLWLVLLEAARAASFLGLAHDGLVLDCAGTHPQLRRASQKCLKEQLANVEEAARRQAESSNDAISEAQMNKIRGFLGNTAAACGLLNGWRGRRHFLLRIDAIETLVLAAVAPGREVEFERFVTEWLYERCRIVIGREAAGRAGLLASFDATIFEENERKLSEQMRATGMLRVYSDATRMVAPGVTQ